MADSNNTILLTKTLDPEIIRFGKHKDRKCTVYYPIGVDDFEKLRIQTPKLKVVFDPSSRKDRNGNIFVMNLSYSMEPFGSDNNQENIELFEKKMRRAERVTQKVLPPEVKKGKDMSSSFWKKENSEYAPTFKSSVRYDKGEPQIRVFKGKKREPVELDSIERGTVVSCILCLDEVWVTGNKYGVNWVVEQAVIHESGGSSSGGSGSSGKGKNQKAMFIDEE